MTTIFDFLRVQEREKKNEKNERIFLLMLLKHEQEKESIVNDEREKKGKKKQLTSQRENCQTTSIRKLKTEVFKFDHRLRFYKAEH